MPNYQSRFVNNAIDIVVGSGAQITTLILYDAISLVCGDGQGITYCGSRIVKFFENGVEETTLVKYDD
jgi:predicted PolB exonuclease-like 3'-5' exonuclease